MSTRAAEVLAGTPLAVRTVLAVCVAVYAYQLLLDPPLQRFTMCPRAVLHEHEYYRIVTR